MNPLAQMGLLYFIMTHVFKSNMENIVLWLIGGLTTWIVIQSSLMRSCTSLVSRRALMQNNNISPLLLVAADLVSEIFILAPFFLIGIIATFAAGTESLNLLLIPFVLLSLIGFLFGLGLIFATTTPVLRDLPYLMGLALQITFWLTPIAYAKSSMSGTVRLIVQANPFTYYIEFAQAVFLASPLSLQTVLIPLLLAAISTCLGLFVSNRFGKKMVIHL